MNTTMKTKDEIKARLQEDIRRKQQQLATLETIPGFDEIDVGDRGGFFYDKQIDFDRLTHEQVISVIKALGGKWDKTPDDVGDRINYQTTINGITIRMWQGEPPPNCKIVEYCEEVPAQPARMVTKRKLQCV
jgi:hypothetical protein